MHKLSGAESNKKYIYKMASLLYILALTAILDILSGVRLSKSSYCRLKSCRSKPRILCRYPFLQTSYRCGKVHSSGLSQNEIEEILQTHNRLRAFVASGREIRGNPGPQPPATDLGTLKWDQKLANIAQTWADQCNHNEDECGGDTVTFKTGQNIAEERTIRPYALTGLVQLVTKWYNEVVAFNRDEVNHFTGSSRKSYQYSQLVWAKTRLVGCGVIRYNTDGRLNKTFLVCNYGPKGNLMGEPVYKTS